MDEGSRSRLAAFLRHTSELLTARRITVHASLLAVCLWTAYAIDLSGPGLRDRMGNVKGGDFLHFYTAGRLLQTGPITDLYDARTLSAFQTRLFPGFAGTSFIAMYGPQVYWCFVPLSTLPYGAATIVWALLNCGFYLGCCYVLWRMCPTLHPYAKLLLLLALAYPGFFSLIAFGQSSGLALVLFTLGLFSLRARQPVLAGVAIGSLVYKPQLGLAAAIIFVACGEWKIVCGAILAALAQLGIAYERFGATVMSRYWSSLLNVASNQRLLEPKLYQMHSLRSFWALLLPWNKLALSLYLVSGVAVLTLAIHCWRTGKSLEVRYACLLFATVLVAPHLWIYDLVILVPGFVLLASWALQNRTQQNAAIVLVLLYGSYALPLLGPLLRFIHLQLSVLIFAALVYLLSSSTSTQGERRVAHVN
jgi:hypothetical protein